MFDFVSTLILVLKIVVYLGKLKKQQGELRLYGIKQK